TPSGGGSSLGGCHAVLPAGTWAIGRSVRGESSLSPVLAPGNGGGGIAGSDRHRTVSSLRRLGGRDLWNVVWRDGGVKNAAVGDAVGAGRNQFPDRPPASRGPLPAPAEPEAIRRGRGRHWVYSDSRGSVADLAAARGGYAVRPGHGGRDRSANVPTSAAAPHTHPRCSVPGDTAAVRRYRAGIAPVCARHVLSPEHPCRHRVVGVQPPLVGTDRDNGGSAGPVCELGNEVGAPLAARLPGTRGLPVSAIGSGELASG